MYNKNKFFVPALIMLLFSTLTNAQPLNKTYQNYIEKYYSLALKQQSEFGIPASIILAQGLLESSAGQSWLALNSNNHFGIKCAEWQGKRVYKEDDTKNDCFRKYDKVIDSYEDHSLFIKNRNWYNSLFELEKTDYQGWAYGLKKAGYATDPTYAYKLISLIENYNLHQYDLIQKKADIITASNKETQEQKSMGSINAVIYHKIFKNNGIRYVVAVIDDTHGSIADEFNMDEDRLRGFNDVMPDTQLSAGSKVYLQTKKRIAAKQYPLHVVRDGESMYSISQDYGVQLESLYKLNNMPYTQSAKVAQVLKLRR
ncbi:MAG: glucosaminidase domain-containing protein [Paludibacter sp.]|nr:glucosaminidase domain-containing protein [Paludibacter sp.]